MYFLEFNQWYMSAISPLWALQSQHLIRTINWDISLQSRFCIHKCHNVYLLVCAVSMKILQQLILIWYCWAIYLQNSYFKTVGGIQKVKTPTCFPLQNNQSLLFDNSRLVCSSISSNKSIPSEREWDEVYSVLNMFSSISNQNKKVCI